MVDPIEIDLSEIDSYAYNIIDTALSMAHNSMI